MSLLVALAAAAAAVTVTAIAPPPSSKTTNGRGFVAYCDGLNCDGYKAASPTPGVVLMGGGSDVDAAFEWQIARADGGDFVVLRASGSDGYNDYIWELSGGTLNSITSIVLDSATGASQDFVLTAAEEADALFWAGGDQTLYVERVSGTPLAAVLQARQGNITVGGTSAGCDWLSDVVFAPETDAPDVTSAMALRNPYAYGISFANSTYELGEFGRSSSPPGSRVFLADTHFEQRDRMGRLLTFAARVLQDDKARAAAAAADDGCFHVVGTNEQSAFLVEPNGTATLVGPRAPAAFVCELCAVPEVCEPGSPLTAGPYACDRVDDGGAYDFARWAAPGGSEYTLSVSRGKIVGNPYGP